MNFSIRLKLRVHHVVDLGKITCYMVIDSTVECGYIHAKYSYNNVPYDSYDDTKTLKIARL